MNDAEFDEEIGVDDEPLTGEEALEDAYYADPAGWRASVIQRGIQDVAAQINQANEQRLQLLRAEQAQEVLRRADEILADRYGQEWSKSVAIMDEEGDPNPGARRYPIEDAIKAEWVRGALPFGDAGSLAEAYERVLLSEREKARPSVEEQNRRHWEGVLQNGTPGYGY
jgi:hypothetical protein